jgi:hypothetical protein
MPKINLEDLIANHINLSHRSFNRIYYLINLIYSPLYKSGFRIVCFLIN